MQNTKRRKGLELLLKYPYRLGHMLGFNNLTELHNNWILDFIKGKEDYTLLAHRGSYKTTCISIALAILIFLFPDLDIIFIRKTDDDVKAVTNQVSKILKSGHFKYLSIVIYGCSFHLTTESAFEISTSLRDSIKGVSQLVSLGVKTSITGKHADVIFTDDIVNLKDRVSKAERDLIKTSYMELENVKNEDGRIINTGTPWHKEDAISTMPNKHVYDCYSTGLITRDKLEKKRKSMTPSLFSANYELKHIADEDALFTNAKFTNKIDDIYDGICHIDASYGGADSTAFTIIKKIDNRFIVFGKKFDKHVDDCLNEIYMLQERYRAGTIHCENNADKGYLKKEIQNNNKQVRGYHESMNKYIKISSYLYKEWDNVFFLEDTDPNYINQILDYTESAEHDDCPDSLASLIRQFEKKTTLNRNIQGGI